MSSITTEEWQSELDRIAALCGGRTYVEGRGFTIKDIMARLGKCRVATNQALLQLEQQGIIRHIGYRPGAHGEKVWEAQ
jgi:CRP-like cAMP-binding protein